MIFTNDDTQRKERRYPPYLSPYTWSHRSPFKEISMAKKQTIQGDVGTIRRRCIICGERWDAGHPNDPNTLFCPECLEKLKLMLKEENK